MELVCHDIHAIGTNVNLSHKIKTIRSSKQLHSNWYLETYPDVTALGMDSATHYIRYGAAMGRNPGKGFDTRFYLSTYPDAAESDLNPLLHYVMHGRDKGYATRKRPDDVRGWIGVIRNKLLSLGFTDKPLEELRAISETSPDHVARTLAARELALWHMREKTEDGYRATLGYLARARADTPMFEVRSKLATKLADQELYEPARKGELETWNRKYAEVMEGLDRAEEMWLAAQGKLEMAEA